MTTEEVDKIIEPFSDERRETRKLWNEFCTKYVHVSWDIYLQIRAQAKQKRLAH